MSLVDEEAGFALIAQQQDGSRWTPPQRQVLRAREVGEALVEIEDMLRVTLDLALEVTTRGVAQDDVLDRLDLAWEEGCQQGQGWDDELASAWLDEDNQVAAHLGSWALIRWVTIDESRVVGVADAGRLVPVLIDPYEELTGQRPLATSTWYSDGGGAPRAMIRTCGWLSAR